MFQQSGSLEKEREDSIGYSFLLCANPQFWCEQCRNGLFFVELMFKRKGTRKGTNTYVISYCDIFCERTKSE